ncbi:hypothetical protein Ccrd_024829 [Cynara cardunculus var. scolymus]|uniref:F-box domain-containing protein n=1 Tax=Cynara cardunculus var. scolymus TaxID=59895 RepID=A0A103XBV7_CYNCS|nr:hypothetical protein Ccrd_024829 [Cynara cardunculus var. scolymus]
MEAFVDHTHYVTTFPFSYPFATTTTNPPWMDCRIWSRLPQRLIDRVIAFLPPPAFFRARSVCKRWYSLLFSHSFLQMYLQINPKPYFFIFFKQKTTHPKTTTTTTTTTTTIFKPTITTAAADDVVPKEGYVFDPETLSWHRLVFPLIPPGFSPTCSSGGLICWGSDEAGSKGLILSNPLFASQVTPLPSTLRPRLFPSVGLAITNSSIDVMVAGDDLISPYAVKNLTTESFHIDVGGFYSIWGTTSSLPRLCSLESGRMVYVQQQGGSTSADEEVFEVSESGGEQREAGADSSCGEKQAECAEESEDVAIAKLRDYMGRDREDATTAVCTVFGGGRRERVHMCWKWGVCGGDVIVGMEHISGGSGSSKWTIWHHFSCRFEGMGNT